MNPEIQLVNATWRDMGELRALEQECFGEDAWPLLDLVGILTASGVVRMKAVLDGQMVGFIAGERRQSDHTAWIATLGVSPAHRRKGIARELLACCERELHYPLVKLCVRRDNLSAIALYLKVGYRQLEIWPGYYHSGMDALVMEKHLIFQSGPPAPGE